MARYHVRQIDGGLDLRDSIIDGTWSPGRTTCSVALRPKAREIHAPAYRDRVLHHWLVPLLERVYERRFIFDSYANRKGKGLLKAVQRLKSFVRQVRSGQGRGWYLQLDIANFFYSIDRRILWTMMKPVLERARTPLIVQRTLHAALARDPLAAGVNYKATADERAQIPPHKRLENAGRGKGLPIGNLLSQFLANVDLDPLDQFVKHVLGAKRYLRYVDDFVLVHHDRAQLEAWLAEIRRFLREKLQLELKDEIKLRPLDSGIDFLGYVVFPTHTLVRKRVISHARQALAEWGNRAFAGETLTTTPAELKKIRSVWRSYQGHFRHADARGFEADCYRRFPWLRVVEAKRRIPASMDGMVLQFPVLANAA